MVGLGAPAALSRVAITWENAYAKAFTVQLSTDGAAYTQAYATTTGTGGQQSIPVTGTARYVRINLTQRALPAYGYSMWELQVYGDGGTPPAGRTFAGLALVNNVTRRPILGLSPLTDGAVVDLTRLANRSLSIYAPTFPRALKPGGKVVLFKNWALVDPAPFPTRAAAVAATDTNYAALSGALPAANLVAPISDTFETVIATRGTSFLIVADGKHPNDTAVYLDAATLYGILFRESPRPLSNLYAAATTATSMRDVAATAIGY
ncbi:discoidin domain-containing protein [Dactylosporangium sp. NPDC049742]|uniref:discoidin domain-containing protein n=1 Tax=Dactylosporangium sp. NPDC049742 TaxID=3154737 RepID=UPI00344184A6